MFKKLLHAYLIPFSLPLQSSSPGNSLHLKKQHTKKKKKKKKEKETSYILCCYEVELFFLFLRTLNTTEVHCCPSQLSLSCCFKVFFLGMGKEAL